MITHKFFLPALVLALMSGAAVPAYAATDGAKTTKTSQVIADMKPVSTADFVKKASAGDMYEIQASKIILNTDGTSDPAREFAQQTIAAHTDISNDLKETLGESKADVAPAKALDSMQTADIKELNSVKGDPAKLSMEYLEKMSMFHDKAVMLYENYSVNGTDPELKQFAMSTLPVVKAHNEHLKGLEISK